MNNKNSFYPNFENQNLNSNTQNNNNMMSKILPMILSGKGISEILPSITANNPLISSILQSTQKNAINTNEKIKSDKIDVSSLYKIN